MKESDKLDFLNRIIISIFKAGNAICLGLIIAKHFKINKYDYSWAVAFTPAMIGLGLMLAYIVSLVLIGLVSIIIGDDKKDKSETSKIKTCEINKSVNESRNKRKRIY